MKQDIYKVADQILWYLNRTCKKCTVVGEILNNIDGLKEIRFLCVLSYDDTVNEVIYEGETPPDPGEEKYENVRKRIRRFKNVKKRIENFTYGWLLKEFHKKYPSVKIVIEEVDSIRFPFKELKYNSSLNFYNQIIHEIYSIEDVYMADDYTVYDGLCDSRYYFLNERDLIEFAIGYYIPVELRNSVPIELGDPVPRG